MRTLSVAVTQTACSWDRDANIRRAGETDSDVLVTTFALADRA
jgi:hypothetical protein